VSPIRLLIADDHRLFRQGLRQICETVGGFQVVGEAENGQQAVELAHDLRPDVVLMDVNMPGFDGVQATDAIVRDNPSTRVIILTMYRQDSLVFSAIKAGARGYLLKDTDEQILFDAIRAVHQGEALIEPRVSTRLLEEFRRLAEAADRQPGEAVLTQGEMQVLKLVAEGKDNQSIARQLSLSERTVANRLSVIYSKLGVNSRTQAALFALRRGWVSLDTGLEEDEA
jgi:DNA-binding NarL/FixJ family response regulator